MSLKEYRAKRDFARSPEPAGDEAPGRERKRKRSEPMFCVQKHLATQLHYDFRLEHEGVLLSWAVPKGPSLDPSVKRLAMQTEDHPLEYGDFEGVIPEGYGAGVVMLWDRGTWHPETDDVRAALEKGDLKFTLDGYKLKGSWVLVRTRGWGGGQPPKRGEASRSWLLIKHRDEWSGDLDITTFAPLSVKSGGDFADILAQTSPDVWVSNAPGRSNETALQAMTRLVEKVQKLQESEATTTSAGATAETKTEEPTPAQQGEGRPERSRRGRASASSRGKTTGEAKPAARRQRSRSS